MISFASIKIKSKKSFSNFDKNDENKNVDDEKSNANKNNFFDDINENKNKNDFAKNAQKKENAITKIDDEKSSKSKSKHD